MIIRKIYFDMDGVLADFAGGVRDLCHIEPTPLNGKRDIKYDDLMWNEIKKIDHFYKNLNFCPVQKKCLTLFPQNMARRVKY